MRLTGLWRYPVKGLRGEKPGDAGDRPLRPGR